MTFTNNLLFFFKNKQNLMSFLLTFCLFVGSLCLKTARSTDLAPGHLGLLYSDTLSQKQTDKILICSTLILG